MTHKIYLKLLVTFTIALFLSGQAFANYKHKVVVKEFENPTHWKKSFSPGKFLARHLKKQLEQEGKFHFIKVKDHDAKSMSGSLMEGTHEGTKEKMGLKKNHMNNSPAMSHSSKTSETTRIYPSKNEGYYSEFLNNGNGEPSIRYIGSDDDLRTLPVQDSMMNEMDKMPDKMSMTEVDPVPWPVRLGRMPEKAALYEIRGQVQKFDSGEIATSITKMGSADKKSTENAELEVRVQLVHHKTGRTIHKQNFKAFSNSGLRPFSEEIDIDYDKWSQIESSSMGLALSFLTREMVSYVNEVLLPIPLEGEIIALKNEDVLINIGKQNGVEVGDRFHVYSVGLGLDDPLTENDLGDIYVKMGVIQVMESMLGFSRALTIVGKDFMPGNLVRSLENHNKSGPQALRRITLSRSKEKVPWWDFNGIKSVP
ncbi:MAG: hypothetical protein H8E32_02950 [Nitrospinae bacterium]|nr:hypothetical protein [Nitrospinota bacterium]